MIKKIINIFFFISFITFFVFTIIFYFSEKNIIKTNKSRSFYSVDQNDSLENLPLLKNDTSNIIEFRNDIDVYINNKKKYKFED